jgi:hypothetical protein
MPEKLISGVIAIAMWFLTYKVFYGTQKLLPGDGSFQYFSKNDETKPVLRQSSRRGSLNAS